MYSFAWTFKKMGILFQGMGRMGPHHSDPRNLTPHNEKSPPKWEAFLERETRFELATPTLVRLCS